jgi:hypothetical protein
MGLMLNGGKAAESLDGETLRYLLISPQGGGFSRRKPCGSAPAGGWGKPLTAPAHYGDHRFTLRPGNNSTVVRHRRKNPRSQPQ